MGYKKYGTQHIAEVMIEQIKAGEIPNRNTAYRELVTIKQEWEGTWVAEQAKYLIDEYYSDLKFQ